MAMCSSQVTSQVNPLNLEVDHIRSLRLHENLTMVRMLSAPFRNDRVDISDEEVLTAWEYLFTRARTVLNIDLIGPNDDMELRSVLFQLLVKEFPYIGN